MSDHEDADHPRKGDDPTGPVPKSEPRQTSAAGHEPTPDLSKQRFEAELRQAREHFSGIDVGATRGHLTPLSRQIQHDIERLFPVDAEFFRQGRRTQFLTVLGYAGLRTVTLFLFFAMTVLQFAAFVGLQEDAEGVLNWLARRLQAVTPGDDWMQAAVAIVALSIGFWLVRWAVRSVAFMLLRMGAERLSFKIFGRLDDINTRVTETAAKTRDRAGVGDWPAQARDWTIIALWNAKRAEYLDRFITIVIWTVRTRIGQMEGALLAVKIVLVFMLSWFTALSVPELSSTAVFGWSGLTLALAVQTFLLWHMAGMKPNDFWTEEFRKSASDDPSITETYVDKIGGIVRNLVDEVIAKEWGQGGKKS